MAHMRTIRTITTTHYIQVTDIAQDYPDLFINLSMSAKPIDKDGCSFEFSYKIRAGCSAQCIALELLRDHQLPKEVIARAIEMKNKLCDHDVNGKSP
jgi:DNA mismatch repair ATPase MutS